MNEVQTGIADPNQKILTWTYILNRSYSLYAQRFWTYFRIALLPAIVAYGFHYVEKLVLSRFVRGLPRWSPKFFLLALFQPWIQGAVYWSISAFFFAAIAANVLGTTSNSPLADAYSPARTRLRSLVVGAVLTWTLFWIARTAGAFAVSQLLGRFWTNYWVLAISISAVLLVLATLFSKLGLIIPQLIDDPSVSLRQAMRNSVKLTENWELFFTFFLVKSALVGYGVYWLCNFALDELWRRGLLNATFDPYVTWLVSISVAAMLESPLFIACTVLYKELTRQAPLIDYASLLDPLDERALTHPPVQ